MHEGVLVRGHALVLHGLHHTERLARIWIFDDIHGAALAGLLGRQSLFTSALLDKGLLTVHHKAAGLDTLTLELRLTRVLDGINVVGLCLRDALDRGTVGVFDGFPFRLAVLWSHGGLRHGLHELAWLRFDQQLAAVEVGELHLKAAQSLNQGDRALNVEVGALPLERGMLLLLQHEDHIARVCVRMLVRHFPERNLVAI